MPKEKLNKVAEFKLENKFRITGRGIVLAGQIISGSISPGNLVYIEHGDDPITAKIKSVEIVSHSTPYTHSIGLLMGIENDHLAQIFEQLIGETLPII